jgi:hypothetical protein
MQSDEPDLNDNPTPEQIAPAYQMLKAADPNRPVYVNFAGPRLADATRKSIYLAYMHSADWLGEDSYPINNNQPLSVIAERADLLEQYSAGKPHFTFIEAGWQHLKDKNGNVIGRSPTAYEVRAETWLAIIHGAQGIIYFPQRVDSTFRYEYIPSDSRDPDNMSAPSGGSEFDVRAMIQSQNTLLAQESNWLVNASAGGTLSGLPTGLQGIWRTYDGITRQYILNTTTGSISYDGQTYGKYEMRITQGAPGGQQAQMAAPQTLTLSSSTAFTSANLLSIDNPFAAMPHHPSFALPIAAWQTQDHWDALLTPSSLTDRLGIAGQHRKDPAAGDL